MIGRLLDYLRTMLFDNTFVFFFGVKHVCCVIHLHFGQQESPCEVGWGGAWWIGGGWGGVG